MSRHETRYCYNMGSNGQICSSLHMCDKSPGLTMLAWYPWVTVTAPPGGDGKSQRVGFLHCPKGAKILRPVRRSASGDTVAAALGPGLRGRARARSTLLAALICYYYFVELIHLWIIYTFFEVYISPSEREKKPGEWDNIHYEKKTTTLPGLIELITSQTPLLFVRRPVNDLIKSQSDLAIRKYLKID